MSQTVDRKPIQLIDEHGRFNDDDGDGLPSALRRWGFTSAGTSYHVLAIMGSQSSGKSTLLNRLFGTKFEEMQDETQQTTTGIWVSPATKNSILIMDVEGVDGSERDQDTTMERKTTLFSLAIAEVVLINIWANQINNRSGSNMELIGMVMQQVVALFGGEDRSVTKTLLYFVIRDATKKQRTEDGMADICRVLGRQTDKIWAKINTGNGARFEDFFDVKVEVLPFFDLSEEFDEQTRGLSNAFYDETPENAIFQQNYHRGTLIDGLPEYLRGVWAQVEKNEIVDLPSIQTFTQEFLCNKYKTQALEGLWDIPSCPYPFEGAKSVDEVETIMKEWERKALESFDKDSTPCDEAVGQMKKNELRGEINKYMHDLSAKFGAQFCKQIMDLALVQLRDDAQELEARLDSGELLSGFGKLLQQLKDTALAGYERGASSGGGNSLFTIEEAYSKIRDELIREIHNILHSLFKKQIRLHSICVMLVAFHHMSKMSVYEATVGNTGENIRDKAEESFKSDVKSWILKGCDWATEAEARQIHFVLEEIRKEKRDALVMKTLWDAAKIAAMVAGLPS